MAAVKEVAQCLTSIVEKIKEHLTKTEDAVNFDESGMRAGCILIKEESFRELRLIPPLVSYWL